VNEQARRGAWAAALCLAILLVWPVSVAFPEQESGTDDPLDQEQLNQSLLWGASWLLPSVTRYEELSLEDCIRLAIVQNHELRVRREQLRSTQQDVRLSENFFSPKGTLSVSHDQDVYTPVVELGGTSLVYDSFRQEFVETKTRLDVIDDDVTTLGMDLGKQVNTGASILVRPTLRGSDFQQNRWSSDISVTLTQPLLDGFGYDVSTADR